jgi:tetratricopeptide (TPR) repeat protein
LTSLAAIGATDGGAAAGKAKPGAAADRMDGQREAGNAAFAEGRWEAALAHYDAALALAGGGRGWAGGDLGGGEPACTASSPSPTLPVPAASAKETAVLHCNRATVFWAQLSEVAASSGVRDSATESAESDDATDPASASHPGARDLLGRCTAAAEAAVGLDPENFKAHYRLAQALEARAALPSAREPALPSASSGDGEPAPFPEPSTTALLHEAIRAAQRALACFPPDAGGASAWAPGSAAGTTPAAAAAAAKAAEARAAAEARKPKASAERLAVRLMETLAAHVSGPAYAAGSASDSESRPPTADPTAEMTGAPGVGARSLGVGLHSLASKPAAAAVKDPLIVERQRVEHEAAVMSKILRRRVLPRHVPAAASSGLNSDGAASSTAAAHSDLAALVAATASRVNASVGDASDPPVADGAAAAPTGGAAVLSGPAAEASPLPPAETALAVVSGGRGGAPTGGRAKKAPLTDKMIEMMAEDEAEELARCMVDLSKVSGASRPFSPPSLLLFASLPSTAPYESPRTNTWVAGWK